MIITVHRPCNDSSAQGRKLQAKPHPSSASSFQVLKWEQGQLKKEMEQILASLYLREKIVIILTGNIQCLVKRCKILRKKLSEFHAKIKKSIVPLWLTACREMSSSLCRIPNVWAASSLFPHDAAYRWNGKMLMSHFFTNQRWQQYSWIIVTTGVNDKVCWPSQHNTLQHQLWRGRVKRGEES